MNKNYIFLAILLVALAGGLFILPERNNYKQITPEQLMWDVVQASRYFTTDQVAEMIIEGDPTLQLIDVRPANEYNAFTLPRAINIPLDSILSENSREHFGIGGVNVVFFSDDDIRADQAWIIAKRMDYPNLYVMRGGLNCWMETIITPANPDETAAKEVFEQFEFRKGASMYFTGGELTMQDEPKQVPVNITRKKKSSVVEGGC